MNELPTTAMGTLRLLPVTMTECRQFAEKLIRENRERPDEYYITTVRVYISSLQDVMKYMQKNLQVTDVRMVIRNVDDQDVYTVMCNGNVITSSYNLQGVKETYNHLKELQENRKPYSEAEKLIR